MAASAEAAAVAADTAVILLLQLLIRLQRRKKIERENSFGLRSSIPSQGRICPADSSE